MRSSKAVIFFALLAAPVMGTTVTVDASISVNPIRRVVTMLQMMQKKVTAEGKKETELYDKYMCWCETGGTDLAKSISDAEAKIENLESSIKEAEAANGGMASDLDTAKASKADAVASLKKGKALRAKEAGEFAKSSSDSKTNIAAMTKAIAALEKGAAGSFLQTSEGAVLRKLVVAADMSSTDRDVLSSFLSVNQGARYAPQSGEITGILKQMLDTMSADLADAGAAEAKAAADFEGSAAALTKTIETCTQKIESLLVRLGDAGVDLVNMKEDLDDTRKCLKEDKEFLANLDKNCAAKKAEWSVRCKTRADELLALADTIKILNDDDALELFKKALPSPALLQMKVSSRDMRQRALEVLQQPAEGKRDYRLALITTALKGKGTFDKVLSMIDTMVGLLGEEQNDDDKKKAYCEAQIDKAEDEIKELEHSIGDLDAAIADRKSLVETLTEEIHALTEGIKELDKAVAEATSTRKEEHEDFVETMAADNAAKDIIGIAKNRLQKFYNPKLYKAPPKRELSEEERVTLNMGGTLAPTVDPGMGTIAGTGVTVLSQAAPPPPPETFDAYAKKSEESGGVMSMMDMLVADLDKEMQEMEVDEKNAQEEYEQFIKDSAAKRAEDASSIAQKEDNKAGASAEVLSLGEERTTTAKEAMSKGEYLRDLHADCDWLLQNFQVRKDARAGEVDALKKAKAVLSGADYSLVQTSHRHLRARR